MICIKMVGTRVHNVEGINPDTERHVVHYMWDLQLRKNQETKKKCFCVTVWLQI